MDQTRRHFDRSRDGRQQRVPGRSRWDQRGREGWQRGRSTGGYGSQFDAWRSGVGMPGAGFGFGPDEDPGRGGFDPRRGRSLPGRELRGRGPRSYQRADDRIYEDICERLTEDPSVDANDVTVRVERGEVTLSGTVPTRDQKWRVEDCVDAVNGVRDVFNRLKATAR